MKNFFLSSIAHKLKLIIISVTTSVLVIAISFIIYNQIKENDLELKENSILTTKLISEYCVTPLLFDDNNGCYDMLIKTESIPFISAIVVLDTNKKVFSKFLKTNIAFKESNFKINDSAFYENDYCNIIKPIVYKNITYGFIYVITNKINTNNKVSKFIYLMILLVLISILISYLLSHYMQRIISKPILNLAKITKQISLTGNFNTNIENKYSDEIGELYSEFNHFLIEIVDRNKQMEKSNFEIIKLNEELEAKVKDRTSKLQELLIELEKENLQRKLNEELLRKINIELEDTKRSIEDDAHKLLELNMKLTNSEGELKDLIKAKDRFFSIIAHDLKNPISGVMLLSDLLIKYFDKFTDDQKRENINKISDAVKRVYELLENLLNWGKLISGNITFLPEFFDIENLIKEVFNSCKSLAEKKEIVLNYNLNEQINIFGDRNMISTVIRNLITNALKFSNNNSNINVYISNDYDFCYIKIVDFGVGISQNDLDKLFRLDIILSNSGTANEKGSGLGLVVCKEFIEKHNGSIKVESELGRGSVFSITLPIKHDIL